LVEFGAKGEDEKQGVADGFEGSLLIQEVQNERGDIPLVELGSLLSGLLYWFRVVDIL
jgi:hypothetical protein